MIEFNQLASALMAFDEEHEEERNEARATIRELALRAFYSRAYTIISDLREEITSATDLEEYDKNVERLQATMNSIMQVETERRLAVEDNNNNSYQSIS